MDTQGRASIRFTVNGHRYDLSRADVANRLAGIMPDAIRKHGVRVNGAWFPVIQAFEAATGIPRTAPPIDHSAHIPPAARSGPRSPEAPEETSGEWHTEANIQAALVTDLVADGWRILSVANTATKERGIDVIAARASQTVGVEVKGFPSRGYADPARAGEVKRTTPSTQAGHWYSQAVLAAMRLRGKEPRWRSVIALPDFPRYRALYAETAGSLAAAQIEVWWVDQTGAVHRP
ncbi:hypothetical protein [Kribbella sp. NPDC050459]|uniref:hypothetical protein n=1 Tax=Kribbella sp. NPDC050459 TaxID=3155785 RepID=UPI0033C6E987